MNDTKPTLASIEVELARQDEQLSAFEEAITALGDVQVALPADFFDALEEVGRAQPGFDLQTSHLCLSGIRA